jgi:hypothetical protein
MNRSWLWLLSVLMLSGCGPLRVQRYLACIERELLLAHPEAQPGGDRRLLLEQLRPHARSTIQDAVEHYRSYRLEIGGKAFVLHLLQARDRYEADLLGNALHRQLAVPVSAAGFPAYYRSGEPAVYGLLMAEEDGTQPDAQNALTRLRADEMGGCP